MSRVTFCVLAMFATLAHPSAAGGLKTPYDVKDGETASADEGLAFAGGVDVRRIINEIADAFALAPNFEVHPARIYTGKVANAKAVVIKGRRAIFVNMTWASRAIKSDRWMAVTLLAHEVGHHLQGHTLRNGLVASKKAELEADRFAGFVVATLGGSYDSAARIYRLFAPKNATSTHPARAKRLAALKAGWTQGAKRRGGAKLTTEAEPKPVAKASGGRWPVGKKFKACEACPEMIVVPGGSFMMGSPKSELLRNSNEGPRRRVSIKKFAIGVYEVTFDEWAACARAGYCASNKRPKDEGWGRGRRPVINVSWDDITGSRGFIAWLNAKAGKRVYRLPSEAEWEYAARAGTDTPFWWGRRITPDLANYDGNYLYAGGGSKGVYREKTLPVGSFKANAFGLYDVHGNVWEWVQDCWNRSYSGGPTNGSAWMSGNCSRPITRGGSWFNAPGYLRSANRFRIRRGFRSFTLGFRVARTLVD